VIAYPNFNPDIVRFSLWGMPLQIRWYGLMYVLGFLLGYILYKHNLRFKKLSLDKDTYEGLIFAIMLGVILGGRLGYILFYNLPYYFTHPLEIFEVWQGGMSFHGGALGVIISGLIFARRHKLSFYKFADPAIPLVAIGLGLGRLGNFINGELYGRVTNVPWAMIFPDSDGLPRHPTQLYEMFLEGIVLAIIAQYVYRKTRLEGLGFWTFIGGYGIIRFLIEFVREPDQIDLYKNGLFFGFVTVGMVLSFLMVCASVTGILYLIKRQQNHQPE
jgi:phosphatidylglycerol:prolipoprotein diacylglycerol transferase